MQRLFLYMKKQWQDKTGHAYIEGPDGGGKYSVTFDSSEKVFSFRQEKIAFVREKKIEIDKDCIYRVGKKTLNNPLKIIILGSSNLLFPGRTEVTFQNDKTFLYSSSQVVALPRSRTKDLFQLLSGIAEAIKPDDKDERVREYLTKQYSRLGEQTLEGCSSEFLVSPSKPCSLVDGKDVAIYPFGSNLSQMDAVDAALSNRLSIIEGPPGTGKTQTILNIISNLLLQNQTMLITSPNNEATKNVSDKLEKEGLGFLVAVLGNKENSETFVETQDAQKQYPTNLKAWHLSKEERKSLSDSVVNSRELLRKIYSSRQQLAKDKEALRALELEFAYFNMNNQAGSISCRNRATSDRLHALRSVICHLINTERPMTLLARLNAVLVWGIGNWHDYDFLSIDTELSIDRTLFDLGFSGLKSHIRECEKMLSAHNSDALIATVTNNSRILLQDALYSRYISNFDKPRRHFNKPWQEPGEFRREYPIITSTTNAARNQMGENGELFDYIIVDESSQADLVTGFLALSSAKNAVVVGDTKQLPCVITDKEKEKATPLIKKMHLPQYYDYTKASLLDCLNSCIEEAGLKAPRTLLKEHYRCHPDIIGFCNQQFYDGELVIMTDAQERGVSSQLFMSLSKPGNHDRALDFNRIQAKMFTKEALPLFREMFTSSEIGAATPYRAQADEMTKMEEVPDNIQIDTVHKYQGREKDAIAFITKANSINNFIDSPNLINVAVSRAKKAFYLIAAPQVVEGTNNVADLKRWIEYHGGKKIVSNIYPAFPFLYSDMSDKRNKYLAKHGARIDDEYSEIQMKEYILEVIHILGVEKQIGFCRNYPFKLLFSNEYDSFDAEEVRFIHTSAHADYIFFRCVDRSVVLELEINGSQHKKDPDQRHRDIIKQAILKKTGIPQCIVQTNEERNTVLNTFRVALIKALATESSPNIIASNHETISVAVSSNDGTWEKSNTKEYVSF